MEIIPEFAYLLGALRDGSLPRPSNNKYEVTLAADFFKEWIDIVKEKARIAFNLEENRIKIYKEFTTKGKIKSKIPIFRAKIYSKDLYKALTKYYCAGLQCNWKTPSIIRKSDLAIKKNYIAGFYDAEGGCRNADRFMAGETKSMNCEALIRCKHAGKLNEPLSFILKILAENKIKSHLHKHGEALFITGKNNILQFYQQFPLSNFHYCIKEKRK